jgi:hypothetical protein
MAAFIQKYERRISHLFRFWRPLFIVMAFCCGPKSHSKTFKELEDDRIIMASHHERHNYESL